MHYYYLLDITCACTGWSSYMNIIKKRNDKNIATTKPFLPPFSSKDFYRQKSWRTVPLLRVKKVYTHRQKFFKSFKIVFFWFKIVVFVRTCGYFRHSLRQLCQTKMWPKHISWVCLHCKLNFRKRLRYPPHPQI